MESIMDEWQGAPSSQNNISIFFSESDLENLTNKWTTMAKQSIIYNHIRDGLCVYLVRKYIK